MKRNRLNPSIRSSSSTIRWVIIALMCAEFQFFTSLKWGSFLWQLFVVQKYILVWLDFISLVKQCLSRMLSLFLWAKDYNLDRHRCMTGSQLLHIGSHLLDYSSEEPDFSYVLMNLSELMVEWKFVTSIGSRC